jgi:hypothetical protein
MDEGYLAGARQEIFALGGEIPINCRKRVNVYVKGRQEYLWD